MNTQNKTAGETATEYQFTVNTPCGQIKAYNKFLSWDAAVVSAQAHKTSNPSHSVKVQEVVVRKFLPNGEKAPGNLRVCGLLRMEVIEA